MKTIKLICATCSKEFDKNLREYKRQIKKENTRFFCSLSCVCIKRNEENPSIGNVEHFHGKTKKKDQYTPFRWYVLRGQYRDRKKKYGCDITIEYLKQLWEDQMGICPFTGWTLILPQGTDKAWHISSPHNASLDRIDNSKGYMQDNVRFISVMANLARQDFTDEQLVDFCKAVANKV